MMDKMDKTVMLNRVATHVHFANSIKYYSIKNYITEVHVSMFYKNLYIVIARSKATKQSQQGSQTYAARLLR
ncbi:MAG: hypothetical protein C4B57_05045 [Deltaproteobacteria bacterium]|nr:MAG: hypothetical protein C4B57_05045 [Deltaproteobacteria bacterium]